MMRPHENARPIDFQSLPRTLWIYWDQGEENAPFLVKHCILSWRLHNPEWDIRVLDRRTLTKTIDLGSLILRRDIPLQALSDVIRVKLLTLHGGVWVDASLFCAYPLVSWLPDFYIEHFFAFSSQKRDRVMTTWFLAGDAGSELLRQWTDDMIEFWHSNYFRETTYWGRQIIRKLMSLRKRNIVSNDIWFSSFLLSKLRLFPYPINMYMFQRTLDRNPHLKTAWLNRTHIYDAPAEYLQNSLGMNEPLNKFSESFITTSDTPVHKLNWRQDLGCAVKGSNLEFLISHLHKLN